MAAERPWECDRRLPFQEIEGRVVVVVPARRELHELDDVGTLIWRELGKGRDVDDLVEAVCGEFEVEPDRAEKDILGFLEALERKGLVTRG